MLVHLLTASGAFVGLWGIHAAADGRFRDAFLAMVAATVIDGLDGWLSRRFDIARRAPHIDGARLDDIVDYGTFVVLPAFVLVRVGLAPGAWNWVAAGAMLLASAYGFARTDAKTQGAFMGFPSLAVESWEGEREPGRRRRQAARSTTYSDPSPRATSR